MEVPILPSLGTLSKLPTEIRLLIWDYLLDTIHTQLPNHTTYSANPLSILCASGYLYNEISSHLYHECTQHIVLDPEYDKHEWMKVRLQSRTVNVDLIFKNNEEAKTHFQTFPHHRTNMVVYLAPPSSMDPGQVVLMWQKTTALVDLLIPTTSTQQVRVCTVGSWESIDPPTHWQGRRSDFFEMGGLQETISSPYTYHPDQDIALLPFLRLGLWFKNPHIDVPALSDDEFNILHHHLSSLFNQKGFNHRFNTLHCLRKETAVFQIERTIIETDVFLDNSLDELPGITAAFLRLERFKHWFKDGQSCISPYEEKVAEKLSVCPCAVLKMDPWLARMGLRYSVLMLFYFTLLVFNRVPLTISNGSMRVIWSSQLWSGMCLAGLPNVSVLRDHLLRLRCHPEYCQIFHWYARWLAEKHPWESRDEELDFFLVRGDVPIRQHRRDTHSQI